MSKYKYRTECKCYQMWQCKSKTYLKEDKRCKEKKGQTEVEGCLCIYITKETDRVDGFIIVRVQITPLQLMDEGRNVVSLHDEILFSYKEEWSIGNAPA